MESLKSFISDNYKWLFSGVGLSFISGLGYFFRKTVFEGIKRLFPRTRRPQTADDEQEEQMQPTNLKKGQTIDEDVLEELKEKVDILFVDDSKFKVVSILQKAGWKNTIHINDVDKVDGKYVKEADIIFVDIQGVGIELGCKDEGLGLALILKKRYPSKKVVIYSAETKGERFHEALNKADNSLHKNAEPYEFLQLVEQYSEEIYK